MPKADTEDGRLAALDEEIRRANEKIAAFYRKRPALLATIQAEHAAARKRAAARRRGELQKLKNELAELQKQVVALRSERTELKGKLTRARTDRRGTGE